MLGRRLFAVERGGHQVGRVEVVHRDGFPGQRAQLFKLQLLFGGDPAFGHALGQLRREVQRFEKLPPDEKLLALQKDVADAMNDARGAVLGRMRQAVIALVNFGDDRHAHDVFLAGLVGQVQAELAQLRAEFDLPDVSTAAEATLAAEVAQWAGKN